MINAGLEGHIVIGGLPQTHDVRACPRTLVRVLPSPGKSLSAMALDVKTIVA